MGAVPAMLRFWMKTSTGPGDCVSWAGAKSARGYGRFTVDDKRHTAHRWIYERTVAPVPADMVLDHVCRNRLCVNVAHLEVVTNKENILRGVGPTARHARQTHCKHGHEFTSENTAIKNYKQRTFRVCRTCKRACENARKKRLKSALNPRPPTGT